MPRLVGKQSNSIPALSILVSLLVLTGGLAYYFEVVNPEWLNRELKSLFTQNNPQERTFTSEN